MRPGDISVSAIRTTPVSTPLRVRTRVVIAKAMISRLAAIPSRFQPIRFLKPRPSEVSSPCIHPPGRGLQVASLFERSRQATPPIAPLAMIHKAKTPRCAALDKALLWPFRRRGCHTPYICRNAGDSSPAFTLARVQPFIYDGVPMFHRDVSIAGRNNLAVTRLALVWAIDPAGA